MNQVRHSEGKKRNNFISNKQRQRIPRANNFSRENFRIKTYQSEEFHKQLLNILNPETTDFESVEKVSVMVGVDFTEAVFFEALEAVRLMKPRKPVGYFFTILAKKFPELYPTLKTFYVKPMGEAKETEIRGLT